MIALADGIEGPPPKKPPFRSILICVFVLIGVVIVWIDVEGVRAGVTTITEAVVWETSYMVLAVLLFLLA